MSSETTPEIKRLFPRGFTESISFARALFVLFRALDLLLQYAILSSSPSLAAPLIYAPSGTPIPPSAGRSLLLLSSTTNTLVGAIVANSPRNTFRHVLSLVRETHLLGNPPSHLTTNDSRFLPFCWGAQRH